MIAVSFADFGFRCRTRFTSRRRRGVRLLLLVLAAVCVALPTRGDVADAAPAFQTADTLSVEAGAGIIRRVQFLGSRSGGAASFGKNGGAIFKTPGGKRLKGAAGLNPGKLRATSKRLLVPTIKAPKAKGLKANGKAKIQDAGKRLSRTLSKTTSKTTPKSGRGKTRETGGDGGTRVTPGAIVGAVGSVVGGLTKGDGTGGRGDGCNKRRCGPGRGTVLVAPPSVSIPLPLPPITPPDLPPRAGKPGGPASAPPVHRAAIPPLPPRPAPVAPVPTIADEGDRRPDEVVVVVEGGDTEAGEAVARRYRLDLLESEANRLIDATVQRFRIPDQRSVAAVLGEMEGDRQIASVQPNYLYRLRGDAPVGHAVDWSAMQYAPAKLRLGEAHALSTGERTVLAVIDSAVDLAHPEFAGRLTAHFDAVGAKEPDATDTGPDAHGTAIAGIIAARRQLVGVAPSARVVAARAFFREAGATGPITTTFILLRALDWAHDQNARIYNLSFAGPKDPAVSKAIAKVHAGGGVLLAAAGNGGPEGAAAYPAAYGEVIAVTATDAGDRLYAAANRGAYVALAAPGVDIIAPAPGGGYDYTSGTSFATAHVSGLVALMLEREPALTADEIRRALVDAAVDLGPRGPDSSFGAGRADAYGTIQAIHAAPSRQAAR